MALEDLPQPLQELARHLELFIEQNDFYPKTIELRNAVDAANELLTYLEN